MESKIYSVEEINAYIEGLFSRDERLKDVWITGEISNFHHHNSGHMYFTLKDENSRLKVVMFKNRNQKLKFEPEDGLEVTAHGYIGVYKVRGEYQFYIDKMEPEGKGSLYLAYQQLKEKLKKEGLFDKKTKKDIPLLPEKIGVITSPSGAAIRDILSVVRRRFRYTSVLIVPSTVQGDKASGEIVAALEYLNREKEVDLIIVSRGGGSIEDLWPFNKEEVARAIFNSEIPIISGVGHETDFTISDFVADLRAPTPSAAAELAVSNREELINSVDNFQKRLVNSLTNQLENYQNRLSSLKQKRVFSYPEALFSDYWQQLDRLFQELGWNIKQKLSEVQQKSELLAGKLDTLSPLKTLARGYSVITDQQEEVVNSVQQVTEGEKIKNRVKDGIISSKILNTKEKEG